MNERQQKILNIIEKNGHAKVTELSQTLFVSEMTVRRDLKVMESEDIIKRYHGGAILKKQNSPVAIRIHEQENIKKELAKAASKYIPESGIIYLDNSSTVPYLVPYIAACNDVTVITNSVQCLLLLAEHGIKVYLLGGEYYSKDMCTIGTDACIAAEGFNVDVAFLSAVGYEDNGILCGDEKSLICIRQSILKNSAKNVFMLDKTKKGKRCKYNYSVTGLNNVFIEK